MADKESRTEAATPTRLTKAQTDGDGAVSREVIAFSVLAAAVIIFATLIPIMTRQLTSASISVFGAAGTANSPSAIRQSLSVLALAVAEIVVPFGLLVGAAAIAATLLQTRLRLNRKAIGLHFARLNPISGIANLFSMRHTVQSAQSIVKIVCIATVLYVVVNQHLRRLFDQISLPVDALPHTIAQSLLMMLEMGALTQAAIAAVDFLWSRRQFSTRVQMSQEEIKDEQKELDGDPAVKAKLKMLRARQAKRNLKAAMARATVVVTNPTHYAVALEYREGQTQAPRVVVKGADHLAARIREMAAELRLPIVPNPPLARALYTTEEDAEIAPEHYKAVAEVIAYIWKLAQRHAPPIQL